MRRASFPLTLTVLLATAFSGRSADAPRVVDVWQGSPPGASTPAADEKVVEQVFGANKVKRIANVSRPTITICRPASDRDTGAAVLIFPGGGYQSLSWDLEGEDVAKWLNSIGVTGVILKYRVPRPKSDTPGTQPVGPLQDAQRALSLLRTRAAEWGIDPNRIGVLGFSAGGHLAASVTCNFDKRAYEPANDIDKASCRPDFAVWIYPAYLLVRDKTELAPDIRIRDECPPTFIVHAGDDPLVKVDNCLFAYLALRHAHVPAELHVYTSGGHGFGLRPSRHLASTWPQRCAEWLKVRGFLTRPESASVGKRD
jgi:acetyl esterase/lipase